MRTPDQTKIKPNTMMMHHVKTTQCDDINNSEISPEISLSLQGIKNESMKRSQEM